MDLACEPVPSKQEKTEPIDLISLTTDNSSVPQKPTHDLFDLLGGPQGAPETTQVPSALSPSNAFMGNNYFGNQNNFSSGMQNLNSGFGNITLSEPGPNINFSSNYTTENVPDGLCRTCRSTTTGAFCRR